MSRTVQIIVVVVVASAVGFGVRLLFGSTTASYIVGVAGAAVGIAALLIGSSSSGKERISSLVRVGRAHRSHITGVDDAGGVQGPVRSDVQVKTADDSTVIGVRSRRP